MLKVLRQIYLEISLKLGFIIFIYFKIKDKNKIFEFDCERSEYKIVQKYLVKQLEYWKMKFLNGIEVQK